MKLTLLPVLALLVSHCWSQSVRKHDWQLPTVSSQCCLDKGGKLCGSMIVDCCKKGCTQGYFNSLWCEGDQSFKPTGCGTCSDVCKAKGGIVCDPNILTGAKIQCCSEANCGGSFDRTCKPGTQIDLGNCSKDTFFQLAKDAGTQIV